MLSASNATQVQEAKLPPCECAPRSVFICVPDGVIILEPIGTSIGVSRGGGRSLAGFGLGGLGGGRIRICIALGLLDIDIGLGGVLFLGGGRILVTIGDGLEAGCPRGFVRSVIVRGDGGGGLGDIDCVVFRRAPR